MARITATQIAEEGSWTRENWVNIADAAAFTTLLNRFVSRSAAYVEWRVGSTTYALATEPVNTILGMAEMHIAQAMANESAADTDDADDTGSATIEPMAGSRTDFLAAAVHHREKAEELLAPYDQHPPGQARPACTVGSAQDAVAGRIDEDGSAIPTGSAGGSYLMGWLSV